MHTYIPFMNSLPVTHSNVHTYKNTNMHACIHVQANDLDVRNFLQGCNVPENGIVLVKLGDGRNRFVVCMCVCVYVCMYV